MEKVGTAMGGCASSAWDCSSVTDGGEAGDGELPALEGNGHEHGADLDEAESGSDEGGDKTTRLRAMLIA